MECIKELKKIGIQEINAKTKIATKRLDDIFECRFDEIDRTRVKGFIYILQREYKIDMSEWLEKYDEYHREKENEYIQDANSKDSKSDNVNISFVDTTIKDKTYVRLVVLFMILFILFIIYFIYNNMIKDNKISVVNMADLDKNAVVNMNSIDSMYYSDVLDSNNTSLEYTRNDEHSNLSSLDDELENNDSLQITPSNTEGLNNKNSKQVINNTESIVDNNSLSSSNNTTSIFYVDEITITPKSPLWVGIIDLQTYRKKQISISDSFKIELDASKIIRTGHGYFDIKAQNFNHKYIGGDSKYFIYTIENGLKEISKDEFLAFNRGKEW